MDVCESLVRAEAAFHSRSKHRIPTCFHEILFGSQTHVPILIGIERPSKRVLNCLTTYRITPYAAQASFGSTSKHETVAKIEKLKHQTFSTQLAKRLLVPSRPDL